MSLHQAEKKQAGELCFAAVAPPACFRNVKSRFTGEIYLSKVSFYFHVYFTTGAAGSLAGVLFFYLSSVVKHVPTSLGMTRICRRINACIFQLVSFSSGIPR